MFEFGNLNKKEKEMSPDKKHNNVVQQSKKEGDNIITKIPKTLYGWIVAAIAIICALIIIMVTTDLVATANNLTEIAKNEAIEIKEELRDRREIELLNLQIINLEDERIRKHQFRIIGSDLISSERGTLTIEESHHLMNTIYELSQLAKYNYIDPAIPLAFARTESVFNNNAVGKNINAEGQELSRDIGLFQFNDGGRFTGTAEGVARMVGLEYYRGMERDIIDSTKLFYAFYDYIKLYLETIRPFETKEEEIKFVAMGYNAGPNTAYESWRWFSRERHNMDRYIIDRYIRMDNPEVAAKARNGAAHPLEVYYHYIRFIEENESFRLINFVNE